MNKDCLFELDNFAIKSINEIFEIINIDTKEILAYWKKINNKFELFYCSSRHLEYDNMNFWKIVEHGERLLDSQLA